ncbi:unnamed protein product [Notodromas monacha]|uniref:Phorbol-ester/DAG-type domain-containing protein n=1 Tax=Notodromas monacha TaxID=399045 RepID=A0A7R9BC09_9CRUS|nr:unnamed protein product [Notodromas monacha]CAG0912429.1 unnamed protein product [Notodromas monacha]
MGDGARFGRRRRRRAVPPSTGDGVVRDLISCRVTELSGIVVGEGGGVGVSCVMSAVTDPLDSAAPGKLVQSHGHSFVRKTFHRPTYCHQCTDLLWGIIQQGSVCEVCNFVVHDRCIRTVAYPCISVAITHIQNPVPHCWSEQGHYKRKFCNVCRKRLDEALAFRCESENSLRACL